MGRRKGCCRLRFPVLRSIRALLLFWTIFVSYGFAWLLEQITSRERSRRRWKRVHELMEKVRAAPDRHPDETIEESLDKIRWRLLDEADDGAGR